MIFKRNEIKKMFQFLMIYTAYSLYEYTYSRRSFYRCLEFNQMQYKKAYEILKKFMQHSKP